MAAESSRAAQARARIPVILTKTKNRPEDKYHNEFSSTEHGFQYEPCWVSALSGKAREDAKKTLQSHFVDFKFHTDTLLENVDNGYGGIVFTSQRAVEAFADSVLQMEWFVHRLGFDDNPIPIYVVGPATATAVRDIELDGMEILGEQCGNGENLAYFIQGDYPHRCRARGLTRNPPVLFLSGEKRGEVLPNTLSNPDLPEEIRIPVEELVMYEVTLVSDFKEHLLEAIRNAERRSSFQWVTVFSPQVCEAMLEAIGRLGDDRKDVKRENSVAKNAYIVTIGETSATHLFDRFGCKPDAVSKDPNPSAMRLAMETSMNQKRLG